MTRVAIIGAHGKVGQQLLRLLYDAGHDAVGVVRNPDHSEDVYRLGGEPALVDLESATPEQLAAVLEGADAVVFAAGAGPGSGAARKATVDYGASVLSQQAAVLAGARRFVQISAIGVDVPLPEDTDDEWRAYVEAKRDADADLRDSELDWTVLRPGALTTDEGTGRVALGEGIEKGSIPREDVAAVVVALLDEPASIGRSFDLVSGDLSVAEALARTV